MSTHVTSWVLEHSEAKVGARLVLLVLADHAHADGAEAYPALDRIAHESRMSRRGVQDALKRLQVDGSIARDGMGPHGQTKWRVIMGMAESAPVQFDAPGGGSLDPEGVQVDAEITSRTAPEPTANQTDNQQRTARKRVTYRGKPVPANVMDSATNLLQTFAEVTGRKVLPEDFDARPSPDLRQVISALLARPAVSEADWAIAIRNTAKAPPPWLDGPMQLGAVFGERAAGWALSNDGTPRAAGGGESWSHAGDLSRFDNVGDPPRLEPER